MNGWNDAPTNSRTGRADDARRARVILLLAEGRTWEIVCEHVGCSRGFVASWRQRFADGRLAGLYSRHRGQAPTRTTPRVETRILAATRRAPADGSTHWSTRKLAGQLGVSHMRVARVWAKHGLKPHRLERYLASNDPEFETKAADVIGLYLHPPQHAAVFCVDEKTAIQALDRKDPVLPLSPGRANDMASNIIVTARCPCTRRSTRRRARYWARPRSGTPRPSSSRF